MGDENKNGEMDKAEFDKWKQNNKINGKAEEAMERIALHFDANKDKALSGEEAFTMVKKVDTDGSKALEADELMSSLGKSSLLQEGSSSSTQGKVFQLMEQLATDAKSEP